MSWRDQLRSWLPEMVLNFFRQRQKASRRRALEQQKSAGQAWSKEQLKDQLSKMGIAHGDTLMVHCSLGKIGYIDGGANALCEALLETIGKEGNLLMPSSPIKTLQLEFAKTHSKVDLQTIPSAMGALSETFRKWQGVRRSPHPTESVLAYGPKSDWLLEGHLDRQTPYDEHSPYRRMMELDGKILYLGVTLDNAGTHLHTLEDAVDFPYSVYAKELFHFHLVDDQGNAHKVSSYVHNPEWSLQRKCDELIPMFENDGVLQHTQLGHADCLLLNANGMLESMLSAFRERGVTMYHPQGKKK